MAADLDRLDRALKNVEAAHASLDVLRILVRDWKGGWAWIKEQTKPLERPRMLELSKSYVRELMGGVPEQYLGKTDFDIWPRETAQTFYENDMKAVEEGGLVVPASKPETFESPLTGFAGSFVGVKPVVPLPSRMLILGFEVPREGRGHAR